MSQDKLDIKKFALDRALNYGLWFKDEEGQTPTTEGIVTVAREFEKFLSEEDEGFFYNDNVITVSLTSARVE